MRLLRSATSGTWVLELPLQQLENAVPLPPGSQDPPTYPTRNVAPKLQGALCIYCLIGPQKSKAARTKKQPLEPLPSLAGSSARRPPVSHATAYLCSVSCIHHIWRLLWFSYLILPTPKWGRIGVNLASFSSELQKENLHMTVFKMQVPYTCKTLKTSEFLFFLLLHFVGSNQAQPMAHPLRVD